MSWTWTMQSKVQTAETRCVFPLTTHPCVCVCLLFFFKFRPTCLWGFFFLQILGNVSHVWRCCATADWSQSCSQHALQLVVVSQRSGKQSVMSVFHCSARMRPVSLHVGLDQPTVFNKKNSECHWMHPQVDFSFHSSSTSWQAAHPSLWCSRGWFYCMFTAVSSTLYCQRWDQDRVRFITQQVWLVNPGVRSESRGVCLIFSFKVLLFHIDMSGIDVKLKQSHLKNKKAKLKVESTLSFELLQG